MSYYNNSAFSNGQNVTRLTTGLLPLYLFGYFDTHTQPFTFSVSEVSLTSNVATITGNLVNGGGGVDAITGLAALPVANAVIGIRAIADANGNAISSGAFNVDPTTISAVNIARNTGAGTISYNVSNANVPTTVASGVAIIQPFEYPEVMKVGASIPVGSTFTPDDASNDRCLQLQCRFPQPPVNCNVVLQSSSFDNDADYANVKNSDGTYTFGQVIGNVVTQHSAQYQFEMSKFYRAYIQDVTSNSGANSSIVSTIFA